MKKLLVAAFAGLLAAQPATAATVLGDYNVYAQNNAHISGGSYGDIASGSFSNSNGPTGTNYSSQTAATQALTEKATELSNSYAALTPTGTFSTVQYQPGNGIFTGTQNGTNVFNISVSQYTQLYRLTFEGLGSGAIVNILGTGSVGNYVDIVFGGLTDPSQVVFNFVDASGVRMDGPNFKGSILAPDAHVVLQGGSVAGSVIGKSFHSEGTNIGGNGFAGFAAGVPGGVPEPSTWALLILGFGAIGAAMRRRARAGDTAARPALA